jgi:hypothetical protein
MIIDYHHSLLTLTCTIKDGMGWDDIVNAWTGHPPARADWPKQQHPAQDLK